MTNTNFPYNKKDLRTLEPDFKIQAIVADGMWYSLSKWRKLAKVTEEEINDWVARHMESGYLNQSPTGAKSFRIPYDAVIDWHQEHELEVGDQIFDFIFPARVWDNLTEVEGFLAAPLREIGVVTFECNNAVAKEVTAQLRGIARVREADPGKYKAYCLSAEFIKPIIQEIFEGYTVAEASRIYSRSSSKRRELADFSDNFSHHLVSFYRAFAKSLVKKEMETIKIYIPDPQDQDSQIIAWVLTAIEKFDEKSSVPFSGYLNSVLKRWPYDLPNAHLGQDLSSYQRSRAKAVTRLRLQVGKPDATFSAIELADEMGMRISDFTDLEEKHHVWIKTKNATTLTWEENSEEKQGQTVMGAVGSSAGSQSNAIQSNNLSRALIDAALNSGHHNDALNIISQMGADAINLDLIKEATPAFILELGAVLGMKE